jgi:hypothetical protein
MKVQLFPAQELHSGVLAFHPATLFKQLDIPIDLHLIQVLPSVLLISIMKFRRSYVFTAHGL